MRLKKKSLLEKEKNQQILTYRKPKFRQKKKTDKTSKKKTFILTGKEGFRVILYIPNNTKNPKDKYTNYQ